MICLNSIIRSKIFNWNFYVLESHFNLLPTYHSSLIHNYYSKGCSYCILLNYYERYLCPGIKLGDYSLIPRNLTVQKVAGFKCTALKRIKFNKVEFWLRLGITPAI